MKKLTSSKAQNMLTFIIRTPSIGTARQSVHSRMSSAQNECKIQSLQKVAKHKRKCVGSCQGMILVITDLKQRIRRLMSAYPSNPCLPFCYEGHLDGSWVEAGDL